MTLEMWNLEKKITTMSCLACKRPPYSFEINSDELSYEQVCHTNESLFFHAKKCTCADADIDLSSG